MLNPEFHALLRRRTPSLTVDELATKLGIGRSHLTQVLNGQRVGKRTWKKLASFLTHEEYLCAETFAKTALWNAPRVEVLREEPSLCADWTHSTGHNSRVKRHS